jgi:hypothetical protein
MQNHWNLLTSRNNNQSKKNYSHKNPNVLKNKKYKAKINMKNPSITRMILMIQMKILNLNKLNKTILKDE